MTSLNQKPRSRTVVALVVAASGITLGVGGIALLHPFDPGAASRLTIRPAAQTSPQPLPSAAIRSRIEPSVVDVTATLTYDDETASGTGFVVDARNGLILTNNHVIRDATSVSVTVPATGQNYPATIVGVDLSVDIAVLSIKPTAGLRSAPLGEEATAAAGTPVVSFGNQAGAGGSPTIVSGVITGTGRTIQANDGAAGFSETLHNMLATTAQIEPGDSGGPLADTGGTVVGVDTAAGTGGTSTGYAIPIDAAMAAERQITARRPGQGISLGVGGFLGVIVGSSSASSPVTQEQQERSIRTGAPASPAPSRCVLTQAAATVPATIAPAAAGALVVSVLCGTGAATAGIAPGDVIVTADGRRVDSASTLTTIVNGCLPGTLVQVTWVTMSGATRSGWVRLSTAPAL